MKHLYEAIQERVSGWRSAHYPGDDFPTIGEILEYAVLPESDNPRFLRRPQLRALETYDGQVFNVALTDVPARKADLVSGRYELPSPAGPTTVAVKITDMLGEEVLISRSLD